MATELMQICGVQHVSHPPGMQGLKAFQATEGMVPDIISIATNYWDIAAL